MGKKEETLHVRLSKIQFDQFRKKAKERKENRSKLVRKWINEYLNDEK